MSELLEETLEKLKTAERFKERTKKFDDTELDRILSIRNEAKLEVWQEVTKLVEKHEKSKELLQVKPSAFASSLTDVSRQKGYIKPKLTDEQQQLYKILKEAYADASEIYSIPIQETINYLMNEVFARDFNDKDIAVALRKFLSEVE